LVGLNQREALTTKVKLLQHDQQEHNKQKERLAKGQQLLTETHAAIKAVGKIDFDPQEYAQLLESIKANKEAYLQYKIDQNRVAQLPDKEQAVVQLKERITNGQKAIKEKEKEIKQLKFSDDLFQQSRTQQDASEQEKNEAQRSLNAEENNLLQTRNDVEKLSLQVSTHQKALAAIKDKKAERQELEELDGLFSAFKTYILEKVRPTISNEASQLFERITNGRYEGIEVDDNFEFHIFENGVSYPITRFSGGEIDLANLCLRIGISKAITELSGRSGSLGFLGFDEVFGSQDEDRRFGILHALEHLSEQYRQIYIISHVNSVKEHFPAILQIRKTSNGSEVDWQ
ncbi:MAG: hypothetical protein AAFO94_19935, partial [Bacteroidota bacterium]